MKILMRVIIAFLVLSVIIFALFEIMSLKMICVNFGVVPLTISINRIEEKDTVIAISWRYSTFAIGAGQAHIFGG